MAFFSENKMMRSRFSAVLGAQPLTHFSPLASPDCFYARNKTAARDFQQLELSSQTRRIRDQVRLQRLHAIAPLL